VLYPQNGDRIVTIDPVTSLHPYVLAFAPQSSSSSYLFATVALQAIKPAATAIGVIEKVKVIFQRPSSDGQRRRFIALFKQN